MDEPLLKFARVVTALAPITPSVSLTPERVRLGDFRRLSVVLSFSNATDVFAPNITLHQSVDSAGTAEKALAFFIRYQNLDTDASDTMAAAQVTSDLFPADNTDNANLLYAIEIDGSDMDNGFDYVRVGLSNAANTTVSAFYVLHGTRAQPLVDRSVTS